eukprot:228796-Rhodomonas_salina.1
MGRRGSGRGRTRPGGERWGGHHRDSAALALAAVDSDDSGPGRGELEACWPAPPGRQRRYFASGRNAVVRTATER